MSTEIAKIEITAEQKALIKKTIAQGATDDELQLFFYDCQRRGIHPLDKLIHFTKRSGKYTPVTSIDLMRIRAADSGEYAGNDDATFTYREDDPKYPVSAVVTVWRLVGGTRCPFTATARWSEYCPQDAFMWKKMPCTMLAKCAEALALRKAFPGQLQGLYAKEEMDQAGSEPKMAPQDAKAFVDNTMAQLKVHMEMGGRMPNSDNNLPPIPAEIPPQQNHDQLTSGFTGPDNYVPYEEAENEARFTLVEVRSTTTRDEPLKTAKGDPFRRIIWREGWANCFERLEFNTLDKLKPGDVVTVEIKKNGTRTNIMRVLEAGRPSGRTELAPILEDDAALFVSEGEGMPF